MNLRRLSILSLAFVSLAALATPARAVTIYATVYGGTTKFGRFDSATGAFTAIPTTGLGATQQLASLAWDGSLGAFRVVVTSGPVGFLSTITTSGLVSGSVALAGGGLGGYQGMTTSGSGAPLYTFRNAVGLAYQLGVTNTTSGAWSSVSGAYSGFPLESFPQQYGSIVFDGDTIYAAGNTGGGNIFGRMSTTTGLFTQVGSANNAFNGMAVTGSGAQFYGVTSEGSAPGIYSLNVGTGVPTLLASVTGFGSETGVGAVAMAASPVPEPMMLSSSAAVVAAMCGWRQLRRRRAASTAATSSRCHSPRGR
jgi:hypothetical protein